MEKNEAELVAVKTVVDGPAPAFIKNRIQKCRVRGSVALRITSYLLLAALMFYAIEGAIEANYSVYGIALCSFGIALAFFWSILMRVLKKNKSSLSIWDTFRVNELYEEGIIATGPYSKIILEWDEIRDVYMTKDMILVMSDEYEVLWQTQNLNVEALTVIYNFINTHAPKGTIHKKEEPIAKINLLYKVPEIPARVNLITKAGFTVSKTKSASERWGVLLTKAGGFFLLAAMTCGAIMGSSVDFHNAIMNNGLIWFAIFSIFLGLASYGICLLAEKEKKEKTGFIYFYPMGVVIADGKNQIFKAKDEITIVSKKEDYVVADAVAYEINQDQTFDIETVRNYGK